MNTEPSRFDYVKYDEQSIQLQNIFKAAVKDVEDAIERLDAAIHNVDQLICDRLVTKNKWLPPNGETARLRLDEIIGGSNGETRGADDLLIALEETYMWIGKSIRDLQIERNGSAELQEERANS